MESIDLLKKYWKHEKFRPFQENIINKVLNNEDLLALLPTGGGKSICFQIPALLKKGTTLVVSPLISLMRDQVINLKEKGIPAEFISNEKTQSEINWILEEALKENLKLLYVSPERLQNKNFIEHIKNINISFLAVDEAHCISGWGHDFRPSYLKLTTFRKVFPYPSILALSASATIEVSQDICKKLNFRKEQIIKSSFFRKNLSYQIFYSQNKYLDLVFFLKKYKGPSIIYLRNREKTKEVSAYLNKNGFSSDYYHAGLTSQEKDQKEKNWKNESTPIIVATNAFGMGIDKSNVYFVCHFDEPESIESYFQEVGRAGRDEQKAFGVLLYEENKTNYLEKNILHKSLYEKIYKSLFDFYKIALRETSSKVFFFDLDFFLKKYSFSKRETLKVMGHLEISEIIKISKEKFYALHIFQNKKLQNNLANYLLDYLIRKYPEIKYKEVEINFYELQKKINSSFEELKNTLQELINQKILKCKKYEYKIGFFSNREEEMLEKSWLAYEKKQNQKIKRFKTFLSFIKNKKTCRSKMLLEYFGEKNLVDCEICDFCLKKETSKINFEKIYLFIKEKPREFSEILIHFDKYRKEKIREIILKNLKEEKLKLNEKNQLSL